MKQEFFPKLSPYKYAVFTVWTPTYINMPCAVILMKTEVLCVWGESYIHVSTQIPWLHSESNNEKMNITSNTCAVTYLYNCFFLWSNWFLYIFFQSPQHHRFQNELKLLHFCFSLQSSKFLEEGLTAWELCWLQEVEQREQFIYIVLERSSR